jgi:hypothetical protein
MGNTLCQSKDILPFNRTETQEKNIELQNKTIRIVENNNICILLGKNNKLLQKELKKFDFIQTLDIKTNKICRFTIINKDGEIFNKKNILFILNFSLIDKKSIMFYKRYLNTFDNSFKKIVISLNQKKLEFLQNEYIEYKRIDYNSNFKKVKNKLSNFDLPVDILIQIFSYNPYFFWNNFSLVNKKWLQATQTDLLWKIHFEIYFDVKNKKNFKKSFQNRINIKDLNYIVSQNYKDETDLNYLELIMNSKLKKN